MPAPLTVPVENRELLESVFGGWPSFHDAEIHSICLERTSDPLPRLDARIHLWQMTSEIDARGNYVLTQHTLVTLRFSQVSEVTLEGFNNQNVLSGLSFTASTDEDGAPALSVSMPTVYGCDAAFKCRHITVLSAEPFAPKA